MKHLNVGIIIVTIIVISLYYDIIEINFNLLYLNTGHIAIWILTIMLGSIISSQLRK